MKTIIYLIICGSVLFIVGGCGPKATDFYIKGQGEMYSYNCVSSESFKQAADMEFEKEGNWYPIYMMSLGLSRYYCSSNPDALKAFQTIDQFVVLRSERSTATKAFELIKSSSKREYELTEREETLYHFYMGMLNYKIGNFTNALIEFKKVDYIAEGKYSKLPLVALMRGLTYARLGDLGNAVVGFRKIIEQNPHSPVGYKLSILYETDQSQVDFFTRALKDSCGMEYSKPGANEKAIVALIECKGEISKDNSSMQLHYNDATTSAGLFDVVQPDFSFGDFAAGIFKDVASKVVRDVAKRAAANLIPGGGLIAGLFLGGDEKDTRSWQTLPDFYVADVVNLGVNKTYSIRATNPKSSVTRTVDFSVGDLDVVTMNMIYH